MIQSVHLLHALSKNTYMELCEKFNLNPEDSVRKANTRNLEGKISQIHLYNTVYRDGSHTWYLKTNMNMENFQCSYEEFPNRLYEEYEALFGGILKHPEYGYQNSACYYIEYGGMIEVEDVDKEFRYLEKGKCVPEQLDKDLWDKYYIQKGSLGLYLNKKDNIHIESVIRCHGAALKRRYGSNYSRYIGVIPEIVINRDTEKDITERIYKFYKVNILSMAY